MALDDSDVPASWREDAPPPDASSRRPTALALFVVAHADQWTRIETALIQLEACAADDGGCLYREDETLSLYLPLVNPDSPPEHCRLETSRLESALDYAEQLAELLSTEPGCNGVFSIAHVAEATCQAMSDDLEPVLAQVSVGTGPALFVSEDVIERLPSRVRERYYRTAATLSGFRQLIPPDEPPLPPTWSQELKFLAREAWHLGASATRFTLHWRALLLALPGVAMFLMAPHFIHPPWGPESRSGRSTSYTLWVDSRLTPDPHGAASTMRPGSPPPSLEPAECAADYAGTSAGRDRCEAKRPLEPTPAVPSR